MIIEMDLDIRSFQKGSQNTEAAPLPGVYHYQTFDLVKIYILWTFDVYRETVRSKEELPQFSLLGAGKHDLGPGIELTCSQGRGKCIKIGIEVGGNNGCGKIRKYFAQENPSN